MISYYKMSNLLYYMLFLGKCIDRCKFDNWWYTLTSQIRIIPSYIPKVSIKLTIIRNIHISRDSTLRLCIHSSAYQLFDSTSSRQPFHTNLQIVCLQIVWFEEIEFTKLPNSKRTIIIFENESIHYTKFAEIIDLTDLRSNIWKSKLQSILTIII